MHAFFCHYQYLSVFISEIYFFIVLIPFTLAFFFVLKKHSAKIRTWLLLIYKGTSFKNNRSKFWQEFMQVNIWLSNPQIKKATSFKDYSYTHIISHYNNILFNIYVLATFLEKSIITHSYLPFTWSHPNTCTQNILFSLARTMCSIVEIIMKNYNT